MLFSACTSTTALVRRRAGPFQERKKTGESLSIHLAKVDNQTECGFTVFMGLSFLYIVACPYPSVTLSIAGLGHPACRMTRPNTSSRGAVRGHSSQSFTPTETQTTQSRPSSHRTIQIYEKPATASRPNLSYMVSTATLFAACKAILKETMSATTIQKVSNAARRLVLGWRLSAGIAWCLINRYPSATHRIV